MSWSQQRRQTIRFILHKQKKKTECSAIRELKVQSNTQYLTNNNIGLRSKLRPKLNLISLLSPYDWHSFGKYFATMTSCLPRLVDTWTVYATGDHISIHSWGKHMKTNIDVIHRCHCLIPFNFLIGAIDDSDNKWRQHFYWAISLEFYENISKSIIEKKELFWHQQHCEIDAIWRNYVRQNIIMRAHSDDTVYQFCIILLRSHVAAIISVVMHEWWWSQRAINHTRFFLFFYLL